MRIAQHGRKVHRRRPGLIARRARRGRDVDEPDVEQVLKDFTCAIRDGALERIVLAFGIGLQRWVERLQEAAPLIGAGLIAWSDEAKRWAEAAAPRSPSVDEAIDS